MKARERRKEEQQGDNKQEALQLSGKIPALGAGGPGSIPGEALFMQENMKRKRRGREQRHKIKVE